MRSTFQELASHHLDSEAASTLILGDIGAHGFKTLIERHPGRAINLGIFEQGMVSYAAGMSKSGIKPILHTIASFLVERCLEQIKVDFGYQTLPATFVSVGGSMDYGFLGATHHAPGDVAAFGTIPGSEIWVPSTTDELKLILPAAFSNEKLSYVRLSEKTSKSLKLNADFDGQQLLKAGSLGTLVVIGTSIIEAEPWIERLDANVLYVSRVSPFPFELLSRIHRKGTPLGIIEPYYEGTTLFLEPRIAQLGSVESKGIPRKFIRDYDSTDGHNLALGLDQAALKKFTSRVFANLAE